MIDNTALRIMSVVFVSASFFVIGIFLKDKNLIAIIIDRNKASLHSL